jgi:dihydrolipoamide dehydrogenase
VPNIYAIGDIVDGPMLAHKAEAEAVAVVERIAGKAGQVNYNVIPGVIYTSPEAAAVGLTEKQAKDQGIEIKVGKYNFMANGRALANDAKDGFVKIITNAKTDRVLGAHILGHNASELIAECALLQEFSGSAEDLARTIHAHPTLAEVTKEAAHAASSGH